MITAEEFIKGNKENEPWTGTQEQALIEFAKEAIKADRLNLIPHIEILYYKQDSSIAYIDEFSIINAPYIELL